MTALVIRRRKKTAKATAQHVGVSVRTIHRDIDELSAAGVPVWADRGRSGGFQLQAGWRTRLTGLTEPERLLIKQWFESGAVVN